MGSGAGVHDDRAVDATTRPGARTLLRRHWLPVAFVVFVLIPLYVLLVSVVVRSDLLRFWGEPFTSEQFQALFAFLGVALGVVATTMAALLAKANNDRNLAQKEESERRAVALKEESDRRTLVETRESNNRQKLDTAIQVLNLIKNDDKYAGKAVNGAAIATLVVLGYPVIAMRTLQAALQEHAVDSASATWVIDQVLAQNLLPAAADRVAEDADTRLDPVSSREEAIQLLYDHVSVLTRDEDGQGAWDWPDSALQSWPPGLSVQAEWKLMLAMLKVLVSRPAAWWTKGDNTWGWVIQTLYAATREPTTDLHLKREAATYGLLLLDVVDRKGGNERESLNVDELRRGLVEHAGPNRRPASSWTRGQVEDWIRQALNGR